MVIIWLSRYNLRLILSLIILFEIYLTDPKQQLIHIYHLIKFNKSYYQLWSGKQIFSLKQCFCYLLRHQPWACLLLHIFYLLQQHLLEATACLLHHWLFTLLKVDLPDLINQRVGFWLIDPKFFGVKLCIDFFHMSYGCFV